MPDLGQPWTETRILEHISNKQRETISLEYKATAELIPVPRVKAKEAIIKEISKDVSAFANSEGGTIVYGVSEDDDHVPVAIDGGYNPRDVSHEWLEQVINTNIHQRIDGLRIHTVDLTTTNNGRVSYVVEIPKATTRAPHQANDHRYYKRHNFQSIEMEDYEVRDAFNRSSSPDLYTLVKMTTDGRTALQFSDEGDSSNPISFSLSVGNHAIEPATHAIIMVYVDGELLIRALSGFTGGDNIKTVALQESAITHEFRIRTYQLNWGAGKMPLFLGVQYGVSDTPLQVAIPKAHQETDHSYFLAMSIMAPRMQPRTEVYLLRKSGATVMLEHVAEFSAVIS